MLLTIAWASVAVLAALGLRRYLTDPAHPAIALTATALAWTAVIAALVVHRG